MRPRPLAPPSETLEARRVYLPGFRQMMTGRIDVAAATLSAASTVPGGWGAADVSMDADILAGQALFRLGRWADADRVLARARTQARALGDRSREAAALVNRWDGPTRARAVRCGARRFNQILSFTDLSTHLTYATALTNAGLCHARLGAFDRALELQQRAVELYESRNVTSYLEDALGELGHTQFLRGNATDALALLDRARHVATAAGRTERAALWTDSAATALVELGRWDEAARLNDESTGLKASLPGASAAPNLINRGRIAAGRRQDAAAVAAFEAALADPDAPEWVRWQAHAGLASVFMDSRRTDRALPHFEQALAVVENTRSSLMRPEYRISFLSRMIHFHRAYVEALMQSGQPLRALDVADASRARVLAERFGQAPAARVRGSSMPPRRVAAGEVHIAYWLAPERSFAWVVTSAGVRHVELPASQAIDLMVSQHRAFIERALGDPRRMTSAPGDALSAAVLMPVLPLVPANARVTLVPDGSLHTVNFETLLVGSSRRYWIEDVTVSVAPALSMIAGPPVRRAVASPALLVIGDPVDEAGGLPRLQFAGPEVDAVRAAFGSAAATVHRGAAATPRAFLDGTPARYSTIHFAAHATTSALSPLDSSIELSPAAGGAFKLYARDISEASLRADLVTISACRSAGDQAYGGEGLVGLAWAFLRAGATRVIAGLWDVDDQSTATLMTATYAGIAAGDTPAAALRAAKLRLIAAGGNFAKPYYWAPFQVFTASR